MKNKYVILSLLVFMLLMIVSFESDAQDCSWYNSLLKLLKPNQFSKVEDLCKQYVFSEKEKKRRLAIDNINRHLKEVSKLRALGTFEEEIHLYFNSQREAVGTGSISGIIYENNGNTPVQDYVSVFIFNEYGQYSGYDLIFQGDCGVYTVSDLLAGNYYVRTDSHSYRDEYYNNVSDWRDATLVNVDEGKETKNINFKLDSSKGNGAISGRVFTAENSPLCDCYIATFDEDYNYINLSFTDENGSYEVSELPSGRYKLQVFYEGSENYVGEWYDDAQSFETATVVRVTEPYTTKNINFILDYGGSIEGTALGASGERIGAYDCYIIAYDLDKNWINSASTDENGIFLISSLKKGVYKLYADYYGQENYLGCWFKEATDFESATPISLIPPQTEKVRITLPMGGAISGRVFDYNEQPIASRCSIFAYNERKEYVQWVQVDENGSYIIHRLASGRYKLYAEYNGYTYVIGQEPASEWYDGVYAFDDATFVEVSAPDTNENIDFHMKRGGYITGLVYGPEGQLLSYSGSIYLYNLQGERITSFDILNGGRYFITGLPSGKYKLNYQYNGEENYKDEWYNGKQNFETANTVSVKAPNKKPNIDFTLEHSSILQGFITDTAGNRLSDEDYFLHVYIYDAKTGEFIAWDSNSFVGGYQWELLGRDYKLAAVSFNSNQWSKFDRFAVTYYERGEAFNDSHTQTISLAPNTTLELKDLVMEEAHGAIVGTVYDGETGQPSRKGFYTIIAFDEDGYLAKASSYSECASPISGKYQLGGLRPGSYYLLAWVGTDPCCGLNSSFQWYNGVEAKIDPESLTPKIKIPASATPVTVSDNIIRGINFYIRFNTAGDK
jgi:hypothetical protein